MTCEPYLDRKHDFIHHIHESEPTPLVLPRSEHHPSRLIRGPLLRTKPAQPFLWRGELPIALVIRLTYFRTDSTAFIIPGVPAPSCWIGDSGRYYWHWGLRVSAVMLFRTIIGIILWGMVHLMPEPDIPLIGRIAFVVAFLLVVYEKGSLVMCAVMWAGLMWEAGPDATLSVMSDIPCDW